MNYLAIITYGRAGSTVLQHVLNQQPGLLVRGENSNALQGLYATYHALSQAKKQGGKESYCPWYGAGLLDKRALLSSMRGMVTEHILRPENDTQTVGFKEIRYTPNYYVNYEHLIDHLSFMNDLFPGIRFLINRRLPETTAGSGWWPSSPGALEQLQTSYRWLGMAHEDLERKLRRPAAILTEYEDWSENSDALKPVWEFLDIPWNSKAVHDHLQIRLAHS